jgi:hypothetical protein
VNQGDEARHHVVRLLDYIDCPWKAFMAVVMPRVLQVLPHTISSFCWILTQVFHYRLVFRLL